MNKNYANNNRSVTKFFRQLWPLDYPNFKICTVLREPCRVPGVYGTPLLNGEFLFAPVMREYSVQMFLEGIEYGEKLVLFYIF